MHVIEQQKGCFGVQQIGATTLGCPLQRHVLASVLQTSANRLHRSNSRVGDASPICGLRAVKVWERMKRQFGVRGKFATEHHTPQTATYSWHLELIAWEVLIFTDKHFICSSCAQNSPGH